MAIPGSPDRKAQLRSIMRRLLRDDSHSSRQVCEAVDAWLRQRPDLATIAVFAALPGEVDLAELVERHPQRRWVYPRVAGDSLTFHAVSHPAAELVAGAFGIREPAASRAAVAIGQIDAFLCPGLAFDERGGRLGRGRGFYDRVLAGTRPGVPKVGVCFAQQRVADTFSEPHDIHMDRVISA